MAKKSKYEYKFGKDVNVLWKDTKRWCGLPITFTHYYLIEKPGKYIKLIEETGILSKAVEEVQVFRIDDLSFFESFIDVIFGVGNITVYCKDASQTKLVLRKIKSPRKIYNMLCDAVEDDKERKKMNYSEFQRQ